MALDFYGNAAQVLAIVVLGLVWDTKYFDKEHMEFFKGRLLWTPRLIKSYSTLVASTAIPGIGLCLAVLAGRLSDSQPWRGIVYVGLGFGLVSLVWRMISHIWGKDEPSSETVKQANRKKRRKEKAERKGKVESAPPPTVLGTLLSIKEHLSELVPQSPSKAPHQADEG